MNDQEKYLQTVEGEKQRLQMRKVLDWISNTFPSLEYKTLWKQPMFLDHGTFIIGFSAAGKHLAVSPEAKGIQQFAKEIENAGYTHSKNLFRIGWDEPIDFELLEKIISYNRMDKAECTNFWR